MKPINFLHSLSPKEQQKVYTWYQVSLFLMSTMIICIATLQTMQIKKLFTTKKELQRLMQKKKYSTAILDEEKKLKDKRTTLEKQQQVIITSKSRQKEVIAALQTIYQNIGESSRIKTLSLNNKAITLSFTTPDIQQAHSLAKKISTSQYFSSATINALRPETEENKQHFITHIHALLT